MSRQTVPGIPAGSVQRDVKLAGHCTWGIGGPADLFITARSEADFNAAMDYLNEAGIPWFLLGSGSNVLFSDAGYRGAVITLAGELAALEFVGNELTAGAGGSLRGAAEAALKAGLGGLHRLAGIPGSIGGAVVMNAGANGAEMADVLDSIRVWSDGSVSDRPLKDLRLAYRRGPLQPDEVVLRASFRLMPTDRDELKAEMQRDVESRSAKHPRGRSAGSTFKNPPERGAGRLIEAAGLAGLRRGGAVISEKHANFIINRDGATAADVSWLMSQAKARVKEMFGIELEPEVRLIGEF